MKEKLFNDINRETELKEEEESIEKSFHIYLEYSEIKKKENMKNKRKHLMTCPISTLWEHKTAVYMNLHD